jgi:hypothetical protein
LSPLRRDSSNPTSPVNRSRRQNPTDGVDEPLPRASCG